MKRYLLPFLAILAIAFAFIVATPKHALAGQPPVGSMQLPKVSTPPTCSATTLGSMVYYRGGPQEGQGKVCVCMGGGVGDAGSFDSGIPYFWCSIQSTMTYNGNCDAGDCAPLKCGVGSDLSATACP